jgi:hypothetical protein
MIAPWKAAFWDHNFFIESLPLIETVLGNVFVRGAVSGIGGLTAIAGLAEIVALFGLRLRGKEATEHSQR